MDSQERRDPLSLPSSLEDWANGFSSPERIQETRQSLANINNRKMLSFEQCEQLVNSLEILVALELNADVTLLLMELNQSKEFCFHVITFFEKVASSLFYDLHAEEQHELCKRPLDLMAKSSKFLVHLQSCTSLSAPLRTFAFWMIKYLTSLCRNKLPEGNVRVQVSKVRDVLRTLPAVDGELPSDDEDFRNVPIEPTLEDILGLRSTLPALKAFEAESVEDLVRNSFYIFRESVVLKIREHFRDFWFKRAQSTHRIYDNVRIVNIMFGRNRFCVEIQSKREFVFNSKNPRLHLCLTPNNFETMVFVSIVRRGSKAGMVYATTQENMLSICSTMLNVPLTALCIILPFKLSSRTMRAFQTLETGAGLAECFVHDAINEEPPNFLNLTTTYDLSVLGSREVLRETKVCKDDFQHLFILEERLRYIKLLIDPWPNLTDFGYDKWQCRAMKGALTSRISLIEGPPGTGKTFVALNVLRALLANESVWSRNRSSPILIVSHCEQTLGEFLVKVKEFCDSIATIGVANSELMEIQLQRSYLTNYYKREMSDNEIMVAKLMQDLNNLDNNWLPVEAVGVLKEKKSSTHIVSFANANCPQDQIHFHRGLEQWLLYGEDVLEKDVEDCLSDIIDCVSSPGKEYTFNVLNLNKDFEYYINLGSQMSEDEASTVQDIYMLGKEERWQLYRLWVNLFRNSVLNWIKVYVAESGVMMNEMTRLQDNHDVETLKNFRIIGLTTSNIVNWWNLVSGLGCKIVMVKQAESISPWNLWLLLGPKTEQLILFGDHAEPKDASFLNWNLSGPGPLNILKQNGLRTYSLQVQHRVDLSIWSFYQAWYQSIHRAKKYICKDGPRGAKVKGVRRSVFFVNAKWTKEDIGAQYVVRLCNFLLQQGYESSQIAVIVLGRRRKTLIDSAMNNDHIRGILTSASNDFIGKQSDIMILFAGRLVTKECSWFLKQLEFVLLRSKFGFFGVGNFKELQKNCPDFWKPLADVLETKGCTSDALELYCVRHPEISNQVSLPEDFTVFKDGGCSQPCGIRLRCGHPCPKACHSYNMEHFIISCTQMCHRPLCSSHQCENRCHYPDSCGNCAIKVRKTRSLCGHSVLVGCDVNPNLEKCSEQCTKKLSCGHKCPKKCGEDCLTAVCEKIVHIMLPCRHRKVEMVCSKKNKNELLIEMCSEKCNATLLCGHFCKGNCYSCSQGRLHAKCEEQCNRKLVCGHVCKVACSKNCPPCKAPCGNYCEHSRCEHPCGQYCPPCRMGCRWSCPHYQCTNVCGEPCNRPVCEYNCPKILPCDHSCAGICGEPCPKLCRICDKEELESVFFGLETQAGSRFVELQDCGHIFEYNALCKWLNRAEGPIEPKICPKCTKPIRLTKVFNTIVQGCWKDIERVKNRHHNRNDENRCSIVQVQQSFEKLQKKLLLFHSLHKDKYLSGDIFFAVSQEKQKFEAKRDMGQEDIDYAFNVIEIFEKINYEFRKDPEDEFTYKYCQRVSKVLRFIQVKFDNSAQQLVDLQKEISVLCHFAEILNWRNRFTCLREGVQKRLNKALKIISKLEPLEVDQLEKFKLLFKDTAFRQTDIGLSVEEKGLVLRAMNFGETGHWYKCRNGHVYCITECGGAVEVTRCPECKELIGGEDHQLLSSNEVAGEMDGAVAGAYDLNRWIMN